MLNYMRSEYYHIRRNKAYLGTVLVLAGIMLTAIICLRQFSDQFHFQTGLRLDLFSMMTSSFPALATVLAAVLEHDEYAKNHTMKNSVAFGFPRPVIYLGKFIPHLLACTAAYLALPLFYLGVGSLVLQPPAAAEFLYLLRLLAGAYPLSIACLSICFCFFTNCGSSWKGVLSAMGMIYILPEVFRLVGYKIPKFNILSQYSPHNMLCSQSGTPGVSYFWDTSLGMTQCYVIGILYTLLFIGIGIYWMQKREIR